MAENKITCRQCKKPFSSINHRAKLCGPCKKANTLASQRLYNGIGQGRKKTTKHEKPKPAPQSTAKREALLNKRQRRLDAAVDARLFSDCASSPARVIRPTDPDFEEIAQTVTPINRITREDHLPMVMPFGRHYLENGGFKIR